MKRRDFIRRYGHSALLSCFALGGITGWALPFLASSRTRKVVIHFPPNKSFATFQSDLSKWMNVALWNQYLAQSKASGALVSVSREIGANSVAYSYTFRNTADLNAFVRDAQARCEVDLSNREKLGYSDSVMLA